MAESSRYAVLRRVDLGELNLPEDAISLLPVELYEFVGSTEAHDFRDAILIVGRDREGDYVAPPAARWENNRDGIDVERNPVVTLRSQKQKPRRATTRAAA